MQCLVCSHILKGIKSAVNINKLIHFETFAICIAQGNQDVGISDLVEAPEIFEEVISNTYWVKACLNRKVCSRMYTAVLCFDACSTMYMMIMYYVIAKSL